MQGTWFALLSIEAGWSNSAVMHAQGDGAASRLSVVVYLALLHTTADDNRSTPADQLLFNRLA